MDGLKKEKWVVAAKKADFTAIGERFGIDPVIARILRNREVTGDDRIRDYLYGGREALHDPHLLKDADRAAAILKKKIEEHKKIRIIGDYDIDGVEATCILLKGLRRCGADVDAAIPDRMKDGYGINENLIHTARAASVDTILTCDNGIAAADEIAAAKAAGMTVIVTDHHDIPEILPPADAIINPKQQDCPYPFKGLCGAAVAWKLVQVLYAAMGIEESEADGFIENAGFATVGDVMDLQGENRILVKIGLSMLNRTSSPGMRALILQNQLEPGSIRASHIGFKLGPCLNASGRLDTATRALKLLLCEDAAEAGHLAAELVALNEERKEMTALAVADAKQVIETEGLGKDPVLVIFLPDCHESLAGIVAGRIREAYSRPALVITRGEQCAKGSARSIACYNMFEELSRAGDLFLKFGGHPMAAGFSLEEDKIPKLRERLNTHVPFTQEDLIPKLIIDVPMPVDYISFSLIEQLELLEPFGKGNEKPVFADRNLEILSARVLGRERNVLRLRVKSAQGRTVDAVRFGDAAEFFDLIREVYGSAAAAKLQQGYLVSGVRLHISYYPEINRYQGRESLQIKISGIMAPGTLASGKGSAEKT